MVHIITQGQELVKDKLSNCLCAVYLAKEVMEAEVKKYTAFVLSANAYYGKQQKQKRPVIVII